MSMDELLEIDKKENPDKYDDSIEKKETNTNKKDELLQAV
jgi:hypothetical protein